MINFSDGLEHHVPPGALLGKRSQWAMPLFFFFSLSNRQDKFSAYATRDLKESRQMVLVKMEPRLEREQ